MAAMVRGGAPIEMWQGEGKYHQDKCCISKRICFVSVE